MTNHENQRLSDTQVRTDTISESTSAKSAPQPQVEPTVRNIPMPPLSDVTQQDTGENGQSDCSWDTECLPDQGGEQESAESQKELASQIQKQMQAMGIGRRAASESQDQDEDDFDAPFPTSCLPPTARKIAIQIARVSTSQNAALAGAAVIGIVSASLGAGIAVRTTGERRTRPNLYLLAIAESGTGKGESFDMAAAAFLTAEKNAIDNFDREQRPGLDAELSVINARLKKMTSAAAKASTPEARMKLVQDLKEAERRKNEIQHQIESAPRFRVGDITKEQLAVLIKRQPGEAIASMSSEARGIINILNGRYGKIGGDEDFYCGAYSGDSLTVDRKSSPSVRLNNPCLTVLWMIQPDAARDALGKSSMTESGLLPRFLMFNADAEPKMRSELPIPIPPDIKKEWEDLIGSLLITYHNRTDSTLSVEIGSDALHVLSEYERECISRRQSDGDLRDLASYVARWHENALKLALVLHCVEHGDRAHENMISVNTCVNAVTLTRWFSDRQLLALGAIRNKRLKERYVELTDILEDNGHELTLRELRRSHSFEEAEIRQLLATFPKVYSVETIQPKGGGRPRVVVTLFRSVSSPKL